MMMGLRCWGRDRDASALAHHQRTHFEVGAKYAIAGDSSGAVEAGKIIIYLRTFPTFIEHCTRRHICPE